MTRTFIYGSCVGRDTFEFLRPHGFELVHYVARQSVISACSPGLAVGDLPELAAPSPFQRRMLVGDWRSSLIAQLRQHQQEVDLLLWDLCDERLGVWQLPGGSVVTRSVDAISSGLQAALADRVTLVGFGSPQHRAAFAAATRAFAEVLEETGLRERTVILAPPWAARTDEGRPTPSSFGLAAREANQHFADYHQVAQQALAAPVLTLPQEQALGSSAHRWGPAPFHYTDAVYAALVSQLVSRAAATGRTPARSPARRPAP